MYFKKYLYLFNDIYIFILLVLFSLFYNTKKNLLNILLNNYIKY